MHQTLTLTLTFNPDRNPELCLIPSSTVTCTLTVGLTPDPNPSPNPNPNHGRHIRTYEHVQQRQSLILTLTLSVMGGIIELMMDVQPLLDVGRVVGVKLNAREAPSQTIEALKPKEVNASNTSLISSSRCGNAMLWWLCLVFLCLVFLPGFFFSLAFCL